MFKKVAFIVMAAFLIMGNTVSGADNEITVSAAMSLKDLFQEIGKLYEANHKGEKLVFNFGSSGELSRQIEAGAPVDLFASASQKDMNDLDQKGFIISSTKTDFAGNSVVLIKPVSSQIQIKSFQDILKNEVKKIAIGNPQSVPAGKYAKEVLSFLKVWDGIQDKLVFAENVRQVLDYVARNEADAGIVYSTDAAVRAKEVQVIMNARKSHQPVVYPIAAVKGTKHEDTAKGFIAFIISDEGNRIIQKYGFVKH